MFYPLPEFNSTSVVSVVHTRRKTNAHTNTHKQKHALIKFRSAFYQNRLVHSPSSNDDASTADPAVRLLLQESQEMTLVLICCMYTKRHACNCICVYLVFQTWPLPVLLLQQLSALLQLLVQVLKGCSCKSRVFVCASAHLQFFFQCSCKFVCAERASKCSCKFVCAEGASKSYWYVGIVMQYLARTPATPAACPCGTTADGLPNARQTVHEGAAHMAFYMIIRSSRVSDTLIFPPCFWRSPPGCRSRYFSSR